MSTTSHHRQWKSPTGELNLSGHEVHVWQVSLNVSSLLIKRLQQILTEEEVVRASRFAFERERHHFIVARGVLGAILSRCLRVDPGYLRLDANVYGPIS
jgi:4'-phosphopantetheinyl transferase